MKISLFGLLSIPVPCEYSEDMERSPRGAKGCVVDYLFGHNVFCSCSDYPAALIVLDLVTGGLGKALGGLIGMMAGHAW